MLLRAAALLLICLPAFTARAQTYSVTTVADAAGAPLLFNQLQAGVAEPDGSIVLVENFRVCRLLPSGTIVPIAGEPGVKGRNDGVGAVAHFESPSSIACAPDGTLYVSDRLLFCIRRIDPSGLVTTLAGSPGTFGDADGIGALARFRGPDALVTDAAGDLYLIDGGITVRRVTAGGVVTTLAGNPSMAASVDGRGSAARFLDATDLAIDGAGTLYVAQSNGLLRKITPAGDVSTLAGRERTGDVRDGIGAAATFYGIRGLAVGATGVIFVADTYSLRRVAADGTTTTIAGQNEFGTSVDGLGGNARFQFPSGAFIHPSGDLFVLEAPTRLRRISPSPRPAPPIILTQPGLAYDQPIHVTTGMTLNLKVEAIGTAPFSYV